MVTVMGVTVVICKAARAWLARWLRVGALVACIGQPTATHWAWRTWPTWLTSLGWLPAMGQQLGQVTAQLIAKNMNIAPTLEIRPGYRFNVIVIKDMAFSKPYQAFDY